MKEREQQMEVIQTQLEGELQKATASLHQKVMFDDTRIDQYNRLNLPGFKLDNSVRESKRERARIIANLVSLTFLSACTGQGFGGAGERAGNLLAIRASHQ